jgi:hypothetical protein
MPITRRPALLSRRAFLPTLLTAASGMALWFGQRRVSAQPKTPKKVAKYQDHPNKGQSCSMCKYFIAPASCQLVAGKIYPTGWCTFFAKKAS